MTRNGMKWREYWGNRTRMAQIGQRSLARRWNRLDKGHGTRMARIRHGSPQSFNIVVGWITDHMGWHMYGVYFVMMEHRWHRLDKGHWHAVIQYRGGMDHG